MSAPEGWDDSWTEYPRMTNRQEALRRIQAAILGTSSPVPLPRKAAAPEPADAKTRNRPAVRQSPDLDDAPTRPLPRIAKQDRAAEPIEQAEADAGGIRTQSWAKPAAVTCCILLAAAAAAFTACGAHSYMSRRAYHSAIESCNQARQDVESAYRTPYAKAYQAALSIEAGQVKNPKTVQNLHALASTDKGPAPLLACKSGDGKDALNGIADKMREAAASRTRLNGRMAAGATAVFASRDAKVLDDAKAALGGKKDEASKLLSDSDGKVADNATRDGLQQAIDQAGRVKGDKAKAYQDAANALQAAIDRVNASVQAKSQADQQAAEQAAQAQAQAVQRPATQQAPSYGSGRAPARHSAGAGGRPASPQTSRPAAPSAPQGGWSVPPATSDDNTLPDHL